MTIPNKEIIYIQKYNKRMVFTIFRKTGFTRISTSL